MKSKWNIIEIMRAKLNRAEASVTPKPVSFADQLRGVVLQDFRDRPETRTFRDLPRIYAEVGPILCSSKNSPTDIRRCIRLCREQLVETPDLDIVYSRLSTLYERDDQPEEALTALHEGLVKCKRVSGLLKTLGVYLLHHKSADFCLQSLSKAILAQEPPRKDADPYLYLSYICRVFQMGDAADGMLRVVDSLPNSARLDGSLQQEIVSLFRTEAGRLQPILVSQVARMLDERRIDIDQTEHRGEQRLRHRVIDLRSEQEKAIAGEARSPLDREDEIAARRICRLVAEALSRGDGEYREAKYDEIKAIGRQLYANGGHQRMVRVCYRVMALDGTAGSHVQCHWDHIGEWQW